jgi:hypothetical protein
MLFSNFSNNLMNIEISAKILIYFQLIIFNTKMDLFSFFSKNYLIVINAITIYVIRHNLS